MNGKARDMGAWDFCPEEWLERLPPLLSSDLAGFLGDEREKWIEIADRFSIPASEIGALLIEVSKKTEAESGRASGRERV